MMRIFFMTMILSSAALAEVKLTDNKGQAVTWSAKEEFFDNPSGYRQYGVSVEVFDANMVSGTELVTETGVISKTDEKIMWYIQNSTDILTYQLKNGSERKISAVWEPKTDGKVLVERCQKNSARVVLQNSKKPLNFPLAVSCDNNQKTLSLTISVPSSVEWVDSSLFEVAGKGEAWRNYSLPASVPKGGSIGTVTLKSGDQEFALDIVAPKNIELAKKEAQDKSAQKIASEFQQTISTGTLSLSYTADATTIDDSKYFFRYAVLSPKYFDMFKIGGEFKTSFASSEKTEAIDMIYYNAHVGYYYSYKNQLDLGLRALFSGINLQQKSSTAKFQSNQAGYGLYADYLFDSNNRALAKVNMIGLMSTVVKSHMEYGVEYRRLIKVRKSSFWLGLGYNAETYKAETSTGLSRDFKNNEIQLVVGF